MIREEIQEVFSEEYDQEAITRHRCKAIRYSSRELGMVLCVDKALIQEAIISVLPDDEQKILRAAMDAP